MSGPHNESLNGSHCDSQNGPQCEPHNESLNGSHCDSQNGPQCDSPHVRAIASRPGPARPFPTYGDTHHQGTETLQRQLPFSAQAAVARRARTHEGARVRGRRRCERKERRA